MCLITYRENWIDGQPCPFCNGPLKEKRIGKSRVISCVKCERTIVNTEITEE
jgi:hypothetical protein